MTARESVERAIAESAQNKKAVILTVGAQDKADVLAELRQRCTEWSTDDFDEGPQRLRFHNQRDAWTVILP
jgi:hypothetical protein